MSRINFIGGEKGGVGKSVVARLLAQYYIDNGQAFSAFDGDLSHGALLRYYSEYTQQVDVSNFESADGIIELAAASGNDIIVDLAAQTSKFLDQWMSDTGLLEFSTELGFKISLWHVMDDGTDSVRLLGKLLDAHGAKADYVLVRNMGRGSNFALFNHSPEKQRAEALGARIMDLPALHKSTMHKIDLVGSSLWAAANNTNTELEPTLGLLERRRVKIWLRNGYSELERVLAPTMPIAPTITAVPTENFVNNKLQIPLDTGELDAKIAP